MAGPAIQPVKMSKIKEKLLRPALTSHFLCEFRPNQKMESFLKSRSSNQVRFFGADYNNIVNEELIKLSCSEASLPGSSLATNEINNDYTGVTERHAYRRLYDDRSDFTFYVDSEYRIIDFFENWISYVVGEDSLKGQENRKYNYRVNFPNDYKTDYLYITKFEKDYTRSERGRPLTYQFINAYPISINSMPVSYDSSQLLKCTISFTYSRYVLSRSTAKYPKVTNNNKPPKFGTSEWYNTYAPFGSEAWDSLYARNVPEPGDLS